jgi:multimeric flavodoxin WrbA
MNSKFKVLSIIGSPHEKASNTGALIMDFVDELRMQGLIPVHELISLGRKDVQPCKGCWNCTRMNKCPIQDDLTLLKEKMIDCDMLILGSPVYTNQISGQMKIMFDRLFTWCHIFPLLGKYSISACTTGGEGMKPVKYFLQKMLATYGTFTLGHIESAGGFTPGHFPLRDKARIKNSKIAQRVARIILEDKKPRISRLQKEMFKVMSQKMHGTNLFRHMVDSDEKSDFTPPKFKLMMLEKILAKRNVNRDDIEKIAGLMSFEYNWWAKRNWFKAGSFKSLYQMSMSDNFNTKEYLLRAAQ